MGKKADTEQRWKGQSVSRRTVIAGSVGVTVAAVSPGVVEAEDAQITTTAALPATAPRMDNDDYTGLFVKIVGSKANPDAAGVGDCDFVGADETVAAYDIRLIDKIEGDERTEATTLYAVQGNENITEGKRFVINKQRSCSEKYVSIEMESVEASGAGSPSKPGAGESVTPGVSTQMQTPTRTTAKTPGFGVRSAVAGFGAAVLAVLGHELRS